MSSMKTLVLFGHCVFSPWLVVIFSVAGYSSRYVVTLVQFFLAIIELVTFQKCALVIQEEHNAVSCHCLVIV